MKRIGAVLLVSTFALASGLHAQGASAVSGRVFDDTTGCPLGGVQVSAVGGTTHATTNTQGRYRLTDVPGGQVVLQAVHAGYQLAQSLPMTVSDSSARVDFSLIRAMGDSAKRVAYPPHACQLEPQDGKP